MVALDVLNDSRRCSALGVAAMDEWTEWACACLVDPTMVNRQAFQQALNARLRELHPIRGLVKTSAESVHRLRQQQRPC